MTLTPCGKPMHIKLIRVEDFCDFGVVAKTGFYNKVAKPRSIAEARKKDLEAMLCSMVADDLVCMANLHK